MSQYSVEACGDVYLFHGTALRCVRMCVLELHACNTRGAEDRGLE